MIRCLAVHVLVVLHGVVGLATVGALTHHAVWALRETRRPRLRSQSTRYALVGMGLSTVAVSLGLPLGAFVPGGGALTFKVGAGLLAFLLAVAAFALARLVGGIRVRQAVALAAAAAAWTAAILGLWLRAGQ
jgi:hypothetical protein